MEGTMKLRDLHPDDRAFVEKFAGRGKAADVLDSFLHPMPSSDFGTHIEDGRFVDLTINTISDDEDHPDVLDVTKLAALRRFECFSLGITELRVSGHARLEELDCACNEITRLALEDMPALRKVHCGRNPMTELRLRALPALEDLWCGNDDDAIPLDSLSLTGTPRLRTLWCWGTRLARLDLSPVPHLTDLKVAKSPLTALDIAGLRDLEDLDINDTKIATLALASCQKLRSLSCRNTPMTELDLSANQALTELVCGRSSVTRVRIAAPGLARLYLHACPDVEELDIRDSGSPDTLDITGSRKLKRILCSDKQKFRLPALQKFFKLGKTKAEKALIETWKLHSAAGDHNWDNGVAKLRKIVSDPRCSLGTALRVYWVGKPGWHLYGVVKLEDHDQPVIRLLQLIEKRVSDGAYKVDVVPFNPRDDRGTDWTGFYPDLPKRGEAPAFMIAAAPRR
jgi:hypothetical protein